MKRICLLFTLCGLCSCANRVDRLPNSFLSISEQQPALSGNGEKLAVIVNQLGKQTVQLKETSTGKKFSLRHLSRHQPHSSPSLSWNGRYLAVITQRGNRRVAIIEDRLTGNHHFLRMPGEKVPIRLSLSPDASMIAIQVAENGKWRIQFFDLRRVLESEVVQGFRSNQILKGKNL